MRGSSNNRIWDHLLRRGEQYRHRPLLLPRLSYADLFSRTIEVSNRMYQHHRRSPPLNNRVVVTSPTNTVEFLVEFMSILRNGHVPCLIPDYYHQDMKTHCMSLLSRKERYYTDKEGVILFTTGTSTGAPKGVRLSQDNIVSQLRMLRAHDPSGSLMTEKDTTLSFMPWYHSYGLCEILSVIDRGAQSYPHRYSTPLKFWWSLQYSQPTILFLVPRILESIKDKIQHSKIYRSLDPEMLRRVWFGARIRYLVSGGSYLDPDLRYFYHACMGLPILQGYGCTEMSPMIAMQNVIPPDVHCNDVGEILPGVRVHADPGTGVLKVNGPNRFMGYLGETILDLEDDYATGDVGTLIAGKLHIMGRESNTMKLDNGRFLHLEAMESEWKRVMLEPGSHAKICMYLDPTDGEKNPIPTLVQFDVDDHLPLKPRMQPELKKVRLFNQNLVIRWYRVPGRMLTPDMMSLKGEILKHRVREMVARLKTLL